ncbi:MAG TPA: hypothetical protein VNR65_12150 [Geobacterales bacterium]|nr:hypothetical protein [Geobacterales bacterium]
MQTITTIGLDIAKSVFQVHGVDAQGSPKDCSASSSNPMMEGPLVPIPKRSTSPRATSTLQWWTV